MRLSARARYSLRLIAELAKLGAFQKPVDLKKISQLTGISRKYLEQLAIALKSHSLLLGVAGRNGGYRLMRHPSKITIGDILAAVMGPVDLSVCVNKPEVCMRSEFCECHDLWVLLNKHIKDILNSYSIEDILERDKLKVLYQQLMAERTPQAKQNSR